MNGGAKTSVGMAALAVAYRAKVGDVDQIDVDAMVTQAQQLLPAEDLLARAVCEFATQYEIAWRDPDQVEALGENLRYVVELEVRPDVTGGGGDG